MSEELPGYDAWKTAEPPEYEYQGYECRLCGDWVEGEVEGDVCDWCEWREQGDEENPN